MIWEEWYLERAANWRGVVRLAPERCRQARHCFAAAGRDELQWLLDALVDEDRKWLTAAVLHAVGRVPARFFRPMLRAGVYESDPSVNRQFIEPCVTTYGYRRVIEELLAYLEGGTNREKAGAASALYWARVPLTFIGTVPAYTPEHATPESRAMYEGVADLRERERLVRLREFIRNEDVDVRRRIIPGLCLDPAAYSADVKPMVTRAIQIARGHSDSYIRHRIEVQLGEAGSLRPLPPLSERQDR